MKINSKKVFQTLRLRRLERLTKELEDLLDQCAALRKAKKLGIKRVK